MKGSEIIFPVKGSPEGGYEASALNYPILPKRSPWAFPIQDEPEGLSIAPNRKGTRLALPDPVSIRCYCLSASIVACEAV